jgi:hypothetical protein
VVRSRGGAGVGPRRLPAADVLWALEQTLKSGHVGAVLAWLPARLPADALRRLQLAAQSHPGPVFLLRDATLRSQPSAAPLRLLLASADPDRCSALLSAVGRRWRNRSRGAGAGAVGSCAGAERCAGRRRPPRVGVLV